MHQVHISSDMPYTTGSMVYIPYIIAGFLSLLVADLFQVRNFGPGAVGALVLGYATITISVLFALMTNRISLPPDFFRFLLFAVSVIGGVLLLYSTIIEIPLLQRTGWLGTEATPGAGERIAITTGTYGLVRHPGFLWMVLATAPISLAYLDATVSAALLAVNLGNLALVVIEDTLLFPRIFVNYRSYKKHVPFLWPGRLRGRKNPHH